MSNVTVDKLYVIRLTIVALKFELDVGHMFMKILWKIHKIFYKKY